MKIKHLLVLCFAFLLMGCQEDQWLDWKMQNELWLQHNASQDSVKTSPSGLQYKVLYQGNVHDAKPGATSTVVVDYKGQLINGKVFDSASNASFVVSQVVAGFAEGLKKMNVHGDYILYIPWELGYGEDGNEVAETGSAFIPPYSTLIFEVHLSSTMTN